ncbi:glycosyltransferase family 4 protein [Neobacillus mesonae]|uniref:glycosyltransferase family 4 protein n=1 Tax=Neobacillus mesonae TaxID=1193713 RepID=UPI00082F5FFB|nr:glycosyltransferase family 4 protein [Neobacillus mesonae]
MKETNNYLQKKILIIGPYPPPIGGLSIHLKRLGHFLMMNTKEEFAIFDDSKQGKAEIKKPPYLFSGSKVLFLLKLLLFGKNKIIHYHSHNWIIRFLLIIIGKVKKSKVCFTFHSFRDEIENFNFIKKGIVKSVLMLGDHFIAVGNNEKTKLIKFGCNHDKITVIPAFIRPLDEDVIPKIVTDFLPAHEIVLTANASGIRFYKNEDLYGIDMCIELLSSLRQQGIKAGFIFFLPQIENGKYFQRLKKEIKNLQLEDSFLFVTEKVEMFPIIKLASIFIRPTNTDGDAISVREALYFHIPTIASDIVERPEGTIIFNTRDQDDLLTKVTEVIENYNQFKSLLRDLGNNDYAEKVKRVYNTLLEK